MVSWFFYNLTFLKLSVRLPYLLTNMFHISRKILVTITSILVLLLLTFPINIFAKSGCCSSHGGVSCAAGPQSNGNVICNDGWRGSSCSYSGMVMCGGSSYSVSEPVYTISPVATVKPTIKPTIRPVVIIAPTLSPSPEVQGVTTEITPIPSSVPTLSSSPTATPAPTAGGTIGALVFLAAIIGLPIWGIKKIIKKIKNKKVLE